MNAIMTTITECDKVCRIVVGHDVSASFFSSCAINVVNDQARAVTAADAAFEPVTFKDAVSWRIPSPLSFMFSLSRKTSSALFPAWDRRGLTTSWAKTFVSSHGSCFCVVTCASIKTLLAQYAVRNRGMLSARFAKSLIGKLDLTSTVSFLNSHKTFSTPHFTRSDGMLATGDADTFRFEVLLSTLAADFGFVYAKLATCLPFKGWNFTTDLAKALVTETLQSLRLGLAYDLKAFWTTNMRRLSFTRSTMDTNSLCPERVTLFLVVAHAVPSLRYLA